jgi:hypothetical protein
MLLLLLCASARHASPSQLREADEYEIKAAMVFTLSKFVDWPPGKMGDSTAPFVFGVLHSDLLARELEKALRGKTAGGRAILLRRLSAADGAQECHILFVGDADRKHFERLAGSLLKSGVLTVGEGERFIDAGGVIALVVKDDRVRLEINLQAAQKGGFTISSRILRLATLRGGTRL